MRFLRRTGFVVALLLVSLGADVRAATDIEAQLRLALTRLDAQQLELDTQRRMLEDMRRELSQRTQVGAVASMPEAPPARTIAELDNTDATGQLKSDTQVEQAKAQQDDPSLAALDSFKGAFRIPDATAALRLGGYVKTDLIHNFDPLADSDRFIVGSIPTDDQASTNTKAQSQITAAQSRLNLDYRQATRAGILRAFVEGDFEGNGDTLRLRHAFGQWQAMLAGQTWSAFVDTAAAPEEIDFEGLNGKVNVRQPQIRLAPQFTELARRYQFVLSMEDPNPEVTNGTGLSELPDLIASAQIGVADRAHYKLALLLRDIRAEWAGNPGTTEKAFGWGASFSGSIETPRWGEKDRIVFQVNGGRAIARYVNDLHSVGDFDGFFSDTGELQLLDAYAGYISGQHWWHGTLRSNLTFGYVWLDSPDDVATTFYERTCRASVNLMWTPIPAFDLGGEFLWGERENVDGSSGTATQLQFAAKYQF